MQITYDTPPPGESKGGSGELWGASGMMRLGSAIGGRCALDILTDDVEEHLSHVERRLVLNDGAY
jgi:hypothetical protein